MGHTGGYDGPGRLLGTVEVGTWPVERLRAELDRQDVGLNEHAEWLLHRPEMGLPVPVTLALVAVSAAGLGLADGGTLPQVVAAAARVGLHPCPLATGPYLRLHHREAASADPELRRRRPPDGALHVASLALSADADVPRGFYLRTVEGRRWLRGYRCDDSYVLPPGSTHVLSTSGTGAPGRPAPTA